MVSTRSSKEASPVLPPQDSGTQAESSSSSQTRSPTGRSSASGKKRRRATRLSSPQSPSSGGESPKSDSSAREKMRRTKIEESTESGASQMTGSSQDTNDEMIGVQIGEVSPGAKGRKRVHDEIASSSKDSKTPNPEPEERSPSRAANGEPLEKKIREPRPPPRDADETCMFAPIPKEIEEAAYLVTHDGHPPSEDEACLSENGYNLLPVPKDPVSVAAGDRAGSVVAKSLSQQSGNDAITDDCSNNDRQDEWTSNSSAPREESPLTDYEVLVSESKLTGETITVAALESPVESKQPSSPVAENGSEPLKEAPKLSGFSNASTVIPFGSHAPQTTETKTENVGQLGDSLFTESKFSSFAKVTSAFGVSPAPLGPSPFAAPPTGSDNVFSRLSSTTTQPIFSAPSGPNVFAAMSGNTGATGFGASASAFGSGTSIFGNSSMKPLPKAQPLEGIKAQDKADASESHDSESVGDDGVSADATDTNGLDNTKVSTLLPPKVTIKSGEEEYDVVFQARAKLFEFSSGAWKERGIGTIKVLTPKPDEDLEPTEHGEPLKKPTVGRIVMRQEGVGRLILNTNMFKDMLLSSGKQMSENTIRFMAVNSVAFTETQDEKDKEDTEKKVEDADTEKNDKASQPQLATALKPALKSYLLRFKSPDLVKGYREHVTENCPA
ncbi:hypothetical protein DRE_07191 [Drechslerella stenobrocha 248]|uniref:RanBD1 domain-containing protein n=1 Tax=Drechslerella stenobrocha 248 TaxID=1043628 RepID=W7HM15_9PEZI|nr:hypothetical protein DRE_07191 [Drechslerella stenobrocha 248]